MRNDHDPTRLDTFANSYPKTLCHPFLFLFLLSSKPPPSPSPTSRTSPPLQLETGCYVPLRLPASASLPLILSLPFHFPFSFSPARSTSLRKLPLSGTRMLRSLVLSLVLTFLSLHCSTIVRCHCLPTTPTSLPSLPHRFADFALATPFFNTTTLPQALIGSVCIKSKPPAPVECIESRSLSLWTQFH